METKPLFEFHLYFRLSPKTAQMLFSFFNIHYSLEGGSYYMKINEDEVGSFDQAYDDRKEGDAGIIP